VVRNGLPSFNRDLSIGGSRFVEALQRTLGLEYDVALGVLKGNVPDGISSDEVHTAIGRVIEELSTSIRRSFITYQASGENARIDKMYISGGCSLMPGLATILSEQHGLPVEHLQPFRNITISEDVISDSELDSLGAVLAVGTGLALRDLEPTMVDINILEEAEGKKRKAAGAPARERKPTALLTVLAVIPYIALIAVGVLSYMDYQDLKEQEVQINQEIEDVQQQINQLGIQLDQQAEAERLAQAVERKRQQILDLSMGQKYTVYVLEYLCRAVYPEVISPGTQIDKGVYLTSLVLTQEQLTVAGVAKTWGDIIEFQREIVEIMPDGRTPLFTMDEYGQTYNLASEASRTGSRRYNFEMTIGVNSSALSSLVGEFAGDSRAFAGADEESGNTDTGSDNTGEES
ncbi:MAG: hypothetical protein GF388_03865, partial [Candidatus Aegiribacteria sp.]|nr:hypothetical protein [Candidatus Aegiribacteria sp.]MBD3294390.1 hypothetical protein [Candidatus Fermentibacteria bacterium]